MVYGNVNREAFLDVCKSLSEEQMDAVVMSHPAMFKSAVDFGGGVSAPAKPAAKPRERKARGASPETMAAVRSAISEGALTTQAIMSKAGLTRSATSAALGVLVTAGTLIPVGKGRGTKYAVAGAAS